MLSNGDGGDGDGDDGAATTSDGDGGGDGSSGGDDGGDGDGDNIAPARHRSLRLGSESALRSRLLHQLPATRLARSELGRATLRMTLRCSAPVCSALRLQHLGWRPAMPIQPRPQQFRRSSGPRCFSSHCRHSVREAAAVPPSYTKFNSPHVAFVPKDCGDTRSAAVGAVRSFEKQLQTERTFILQSQRAFALHSGIAV
jgi:hypothetical protein